jgi:hypothetical protein
MTIGQLAVPEEVGGLLEGGVVRQVVDAVATINEPTGLPVDVAGLCLVDIDPVEAVICISIFSIMLCPRSPRGAKNIGAPAGRSC